AAASGSGSPGTYRTPRTPSTSERAVIPSSSGTRTVIAMAPILSDLAGPAYSRLTGGDLRSSTVRTRPQRRSWPLAIAVSGVLVLSGCADFGDEAAGEKWSAAPELTPEQGPQPELPEAATPEVPSAPQQQQTEVPPPEG